MKEKIISFIDQKLQRFDPIWLAENGKGGQRTRYRDDGSGIARYREWRGVEDTFQDYTAWLKNIGYRARTIPPGSRTSATWVPWWRETPSKS